MADEKNLQAIVDRLGLSAEVPPCAPTVSYGHYTLPEDFIRFCQASPSLINAISDSPYICAGLGFLSPFESPSPLEERNTDLREDGDWHEQLVSFYQGDDGDYCFFYETDSKEPKIVYADLWGALDDLPDIVDSYSIDFKTWLDGYVDWFNKLGQH